MRNWKLFIEESVSHYFNPISHLEKTLEKWRLLKLVKAEGPPDKDYYLII